MRCQGGPLCQPLIMCDLAPLTYIGNNVAANMIKVEKGI